MDTRTLAKNFCTLHTFKFAPRAQRDICKGNVSYLCLFERSFDDDNDDDLLRRNLSKRGASSGSFRRQLQFASSRVDPASLARAGSRVAVVDSSNLPSAVVLSYTLVRSNGRSGGTNENRFDNGAWLSSNQTRSPTTRLFVHSFQLH